jgi:hypothetical protein
MSSPNHRLLVAGDWNILHGYGEYGDSYFRDRYATVFARAEALGPGIGEGDPAWREFLRRQAASIVACDFFTVESVFLRRYYVLFFIARVLR